jgi:hypothetical protein
VRSAIASRTPGTVRQVAGGLSVYVPIEGLAVVAPFSVGLITFRSTDDVLALLEAPVATDVEAVVRQRAQDGNVTAFAEVPRDDVSVAVELASRAIDVLRVFERHSHDWAVHTQFGVASQLRTTRVPCVTSGPGTLGISVVPESHFTGTQIDHESFGNDELFQWLAASIGAPAPTEGQRRALIGLEMLSEAMIAPPRTAAVALVTALEAWLKPYSDGPLTFALARSVAYFGCDSHASVQCGRGRDTCPYLAYDPAAAGVSKKLKRLRAIGTAPPWRCAEWQVAIDCYELRSDIVHGRRRTVDSKEVASQVHRVYRRLAIPILRWLADHSDDPIGDLDAAIAALPEAPDWEAVLGPMPIVPSGAK